MASLRRAPAYTTSSKKEGPFSLPGPGTGSAPPTHAVDYFFKSGERSRVAGPAAGGIFVRGSAYGRAALLRDLALLESCHRGRHRSLFHAAANAGALIAGGELEEESAVIALENAGRRVRLHESEIRRTVRDGVARGRRTPRRAPRDGVMVRDRADARERIEWWYGDLTTTGDWTARTAGTTLKILAGFYLLAMRAGKVRITQSYREVAEAAGVSVGTVSKHEPHWRRYVAVVQKGSRAGRALAELADGGRTNRTVFQLLAPGRAGGRLGNRPEASWTAMADLFPRPAHSPSTTRPLTGRPRMALPRSGTTADPAADAWHGSGGRWRLWCLLDDREPVDVTTLASACGRTTTTVRRTLSSLVAEGLATHDGDGGFVRQTVDEEAGFTCLARRRSRHQADRIVFAGYLAARFGTVPMEPPRRTWPVVVAGGGGVGLA